ncbi:MAG TPA: lysis system i-spanin subunit Rz, partial [Rhodanobacteraceae bacterium]|nr:lysis system i-spanin subunit Rz [Rhodanobacteraceae bacterium]
LVASNGLWWLAHQRASTRCAEAAADAATLRGDIERQRADFEAAARQQERAQHNALQGVRRIMEQELSNAQTKRQQLVADLRADNVRLRAHWQGCAAASVPATATTAAGIDDAAQLRNQGAGDLVGASAECDARIHALQSYARLCYGGSQ